MWLRYLVGSCLFKQCGCELLMTRNLTFFAMIIVQFHNKKLRISTGVTQKPRSLVSIKIICTDSLSFNWINQLLNIYLPRSLFPPNKLSKCMEAWPTWNFTSKSLQERASGPCSRCCLPSTIVTTALMSPEISPKLFGQSYSSQVHINRYINCLMASQEHI